MPYVALCTTDSPAAADPSLVMVEHWYMPEYIHMTPEAAAQSGWVVWEVQLTGTPDPRGWGLVGFMPVGPSSAPGRDSAGVR